MKFPPELKIGAHTYKIVLSDQIDSLGATERSQNTIYINSDYPDNQQGVTLIHEILHAINNEMNHTLLDSFAEQLYQVLSDNKLSF